MSTQSWIRGDGALILHGGTPPPSRTHRRSDDRISTGA